MNEENPKLNKEKILRKKQAILNEFIGTEGTFISLNIELSKIIQILTSKTKTSLKVNLSAKDKKILEKMQLLIQDLINNSFSKRVEELKSNAKDSNILDDNIKHLLAILNSEDFKKYSDIINILIINNNEFQECFTRIATKNPKLLIKKDNINNFQNDINMLGIMNKVITPVQRLGKIELMIKDVFNSEKDLEEIKEHDQDILEKSKTTIANIQHATIAINENLAYAEIGRNLSAYIETHKESARPKMLARVDIANKVYDILLNPRLPLLEKINQVAEITRQFELDNNKGKKILGILKVINEELVIYNVSQLMKEQEKANSNISKPILPNSLPRKHSLNVTHPQTPEADKKVLISSPTLPTTAQENKTFKNYITSTRENVRAEKTLDKTIEKHLKKINKKEKWIREMPKKKTHSGSGSPITYMKKNRSSQNDKFTALSNSHFSTHPQASQDTFHTLFKLLEKMGKDPEKINIKLPTNASDELKSKITNAFQLAFFTLESPKFTEITKPTNPAPKKSAM